MRITRILSVVIVLSSLHLVGCGGGEESKPVDLKPADTAQFNDMRDQMTKNLKGASKSGAPKQ